jgi:hypothetical protein
MAVGLAGQAAISVLSMKSSTASLDDEPHDEPPFAWQWNGMDCRANTASGGSHLGVLCLFPRHESLPFYFFSRFRPVSLPHHSSLSRPSPQATHSGRKYDWLIYCERKTQLNG